MPSTVEILIADIEIPGKRVQDKLLIQTMADLLVLQADRYDYLVEVEYIGGKYILTDGYITLQALITLGETTAHCYMNKSEQVYSEEISGQLRF